MSGTGNNNDLSNRIWQFFSSMRFGLSLLLILSVVLAIATIFQLEPEKNIYGTLWFRLLIGLLCMNLIICTVNRFSIFLKSIRTNSTQKIKKKNISNLPLYHYILIPAADSKYDDFISSFFNRRRFRVKKLAEGNTIFFDISKGNLAPWFNLLLHLSLVVIVAGFVWSGMAKFETEITIPEGYTGKVNSSEQNFNVRLDDFKTTYDQEGNIKNWISTLTILSENGKELHAGETKVNHPLYYSGYNLYQYSYDKALDFNLINNENDDSKSLLLSQDQYYHNLSGMEEFSLQLGQYQHEQVPFKLFDDNQNEIASGLISPGKEIKLPEDNGKTLRFSGTVPLSVIKVKKDPGVPVVFVGLTSMAICFFLTLYIRSRQYWAQVEYNGNEYYKLSLAGTKGKRSTQAHEEFNQLIKELEGELLKTERSKP